MVTCLIKVRGSAAERGATAVEYALMAALIAGVIVVAALTLGQKVVALFSSVPSF